LDVNLICAPLTETEAPGACVMVTVGASLSARGAVTVGFRFGLGTGVGLGFGVVVVGAGVVSTVSFAVVAGAVVGSVVVLGAITRTAVLRVVFGGRDRPVRSRVRRSPRWSSPTLAHRLRRGCR
jgi:hypothetical protein